MRLFDTQINTNPLVYIISAIPLGRIHLKSSNSTDILLGRIKNIAPWRVVLVWFDFCFTALQHILGHFGRGQLT